MREKVPRSSSFLALLSANTHQHHAREIFLLCAFRLSEGDSFSPPRTTAEAALELAFALFTAPNHVEAII